MLLELLIYVPGAMEAFCFLVFLAIIAIYRRKLNWDITARAVRAVAIFCLIFSGILLWSGVFKPIQWALYLSLALIAHLLIQKHRPVLALPVAIVLFAFTYWQFTFVKKTQVVAGAEWQIGDRGQPGSGYPPELLVTFQLSPNESISIFSDKIAAYLKERKDPKVDVTLDLLYHWGDFAGSSLERVGDKDVSNDYSGGGSVSCTEICSHYYFGLRGF